MVDIVLVVLAGRQGGAGAAEAEALAEGEAGEDAFGLV